MIDHRTLYTSLLQQASTNGAGRTGPDDQYINISHLSSKIFIISQAAFATEVPGPKMAATPAL